MIYLRASVAMLHRDLPPQPTVHLLRDLFGYWALDLPPLDAHATFVSVRDQLRRLRRPHFHLNVIHIAYDRHPNLTVAKARRHVNAALAKARQVYDAAGIGIGRITRAEVSSRGGPGGDGVVRNREEFHELTNTWTVHRVGIDAFFVHRLVIDGKEDAGVSPQCGTCDKDDEVGDDTPTGLAVIIDTTPAQTGRTLAHELGHYLGLDHPLPPLPGSGSTDHLNLMAQGASFDRLTKAQVRTLLEHCSIQPAWPQ